MLIRVAGSPVTHLRAEYWTDRMTGGEITLGEKCDTIYYDFETAKAGEYRRLAPTEGA